MAVADALGVIALPLNLVLVQMFEHGLILGGLLRTDASCDDIAGTGRVRKVGLADLQAG